MSGIVVIVTSINYDVNTRYAIVHASLREWLYKWPQVLARLRTWPP